MTTDNSASSVVDEFSVMNAKVEFKKYSGKGIVLAAPEVPLKAREILLKYGTDYNFFRVASFTSEEMDYVMNSLILKDVDLIAINLDEVAHAVYLDPEKTDPITIINESMISFRRINPNIKISITHGKSGSWIPTDRARGNRSRQPGMGGILTLQHDHPPASRGSWVALHADESHWSRRSGTLQSKISTHR